MTLSGILSLIAFLPFMVVYSIILAPLQTLFAYVQYELVSKGEGWQSGYFSHVGLLGDFAQRLVRIQWALNIVENAATARWLFDVVGGLRVVDSEAIDSQNGIWIGDSSQVDAHVVLYFHGGGFVMGSPAFSIRNARATIDAYKEKTGKHLVYFIMKYPLCPEASFGDILSSAVDGYKLLLEQGFTTISLAGDSAGGNLVLNLTSILSKEYPKVIQPVSGIAYYPWVDPHVTVLPSNYPNGSAAHHDILPLSGSRFLAATASKTASTQNAHRFSPLNWNKDELASCVPSKDGLLVLYGGGEILSGGIDLFVDKLQQAVEGGEKKVIKKRYPYMPHIFDTLFLMLPFGPAKKAAVDAVNQTALFLSSST
ncbi:hypothetical protein HDU79_009748 [Rhizoclosmatium sp. JEL0117]|nr:hypothetical protein HDU79_009748 [Rhizoclosmatium sp. JEL0117]